VRAVKRYESGMVVNPITIAPDATLGDAQALMSANRISGIPVVEAGGKLVGILTNRDVRFAANLLQPVRELMTHENLATVKLGTSGDEAPPAAPAPHRKAAGGGRCLSLHRPDHGEGHREVGDLSQRHQGCRRPPARGGSLYRGRKGMARTMALVEAECDVVIIDTAHGHNRDVARAVETIKKLSNTCR
jgi:IMP dehydrogenase